MSLVASIEDGKVVTTASQTSLTSSSTSNSSSSMDKDSFLQLLVAQMKYQDPLEPTSNTEYIAQYAQFTQVETMQNMSATMDLQRASQLVGQEVYIKTTDSSGNTSYIQGKVDYVVYENGEAFLSIDESLYSLSDLDTVVDGEYFEAYNLATEFASTLNQLPSVKNISLSNGDTIDALEEAYNAMTSYQKTFVASDYVTSLNSYIEKLAELRAAAENDNTDSSTDTNTDDTDTGTDGTDTGSTEVEA